MTSPLFVTIDAQKTLDIDDAVSIAQLGDTYTISVAIADPSTLVEVGTHDDQVALERAASIYTRDRTVQTMLPRHIGTDQGSLVAGQPRQSIVFTITLDSALEVIGFEPSCQTITVEHRLTYEAIPEIARGPECPLRDMVVLLGRVATLLLERRRSKGALALFDLKSLMLSDEEGNLRQYGSADEVIGHIIVQEFMILTNSQIARFMAESGLPAIYRNHACRVSAPPALELANTVEQWLKEGLVTQEAMGTQLKALIERAIYDSVARGHYGLGLPLYLHGTSPLRRYADLVNMRQLRAHLDKRVLPYTQADLASIASSINTTLRERAEATVDYHKDMLARKAQLQLARGNLTSMEDHVLSAAVKLAKEAGQLPEPVIQELIRRLGNNTIADAIVDRLAIQIPRQAITAELGAAFSTWMHTHPHRVVRIIMNGVQTGIFNAQDEQVKPVTNGFQFVISITASASASASASGERLEGVGIDGDKRGAKQKAMVQLLCRFLRLPATDQASAGQATPAAPPRATDYKGALIELCRKKGWPAPHLQVAMDGPTHAASFVATVTVQPKGASAEVATSPALATKKAAEAAASAILLERLGSVRGNVTVQSAVSGTNPVVQLNEMAQKRKLPEPTYTFTQLSVAPPSFECEGRLAIGGRELTAKTVAGGKKQAKEQVAAAILEQVKEAVFA